jgi:hypothetical protein
MNEMDIVSWVFISTGQVIQVNGLMFTNRFETNKAESCNGKIERILRVYVGSQLCEIRVPDGNDE